jgi:hypothetical protein
MKRCIAMTAVSAALVTSSAGAQPIRILVAASHSRGADGEPALQHTTEDADHVRDVLTALGGFAPEAVFRLVDPTVTALEGAIDRARSLAAAHPAGEVTFLLYFSGHGDRDAIRLAGESLPVSELSERVRAVPAALRVLVTDACRNDPTRSKGIGTEPGFAMSGSVAPATGVVWLSASDAGEAAQESDELHGALFTHYWVSGLRGAADANGDGRVTLAESYDFAYSQTLFRSVRGSGVLQHPAATFALSQAAPVVLTQTFGNATRLEFPQLADARYLVYALGSRSVLGEIWSRPDRRVVLAVPAGRYIVEERSPGGGSAAAEVVLAFGQDRALTQADFRAVPEEQMAGKGGEFVLRPNEIGLELGAGTSRTADGQAAVLVGYERVTGVWAAGVGARGSLGVQRTPANHVDIVSVGLQATVEHRWRLGSALLLLGAGAAADVIHQHVRRADAARVSAAGYPADFDFAALAPGPTAAATVRVPVGTTAWMEVAARGELLFPQFDGRPGPLWSLLGGIGTGVAF